MRRTTDESGVAWYSDRSSPQGANVDALYLYAGKKGCDVWLRLRIQYITEKPLTITRLVIKADDKSFELAEPHFKRDSDGKLTWHWFDEKVTTDHLVMLFTLTGAKSATLRFSGANRTDERTIPQHEKDALKSVLSAYTALGGKL